MPNSKGRKKTSRGEAWRTGRPGSPFDPASTQGEPSFARPVRDATHERDRDPLLGAQLLLRGWAHIQHEHPDDDWDMWLWPPSEPDAEFWIGTTIAVEEGRYSVHFADDGGDWEELIVDYDTRADLLVDIDAIEAFRNPTDPRV
jgi:hypothetical protein